MATHEGRDTNVALNIALGIIIAFNIVCCILTFYLIFYLRKLEHDSRDSVDDSDDNTIELQPRSRSIENLRDEYPRGSQSNGKSVTLPEGYGQARQASFVLPDELERYSRP